MNTNEEPVNGQCPRCWKRLETTVPQCDSCGWPRYRIAKTTSGITNIICTTVFTIEPETRPVVVGGAP